MKIFVLLFPLLFIGCATIHFRSNQTAPVTFDGDGHHQKAVTIEGRQNFYWWGNDPEHHVVYVDEEVRKAGYPALSKVIVYEQKNPQDILIAFLTFGIYIPKGWTIMGYTEDVPAQIDTQNK